MFSGKLDAKIAIIGDAPGETEARLNSPFVGTSGQELTKMLSEAGISRSTCFLTNVFPTRIPAGDIKNWQVKKSDLPKDYSLPPMGRGVYLNPAKVEELSAFQALIPQLSANVIVALGPTALWALTGQSGIGALRGTIIVSSGRKILPTYHPNYIQRNWSERLVLVADLMKAKRHAESPEFHRPCRRLLINPTLPELELFFREHLNPARVVSCDIETERKQITSLSFAVGPGLGVTIPLVDKRTPSRSYWSAADELRVWSLVRSVLEGPQELLFQNGAYDTQYLLAAGISIRNFFHDTLVQHHSLFPELSKGLGWLGSIYLDEPAWKIMRKSAKDLDKRDG